MKPLPNIAGSCMECVKGLDNQNRVGYVLCSQLVMVRNALTRNPKLQKVNNDQMK